MKHGESFWQYKLSAWMRDFTSLANPLILLFVPFAVLGPSKIFYVLLIALLANEIVGSVIKVIFPKKRPTGQTYKNILEKIDAGSFPSLHTSRITVVYLTLFAATSFLSLKIAFIIVIILVGFSRVFLKKHYPVDVLGGLVCGLLIFWLSNFFY